MAEIRWHPRARRILQSIDERQAVRIERALERVERFPFRGTPIEGIRPRLRRVLAGGGRTAWSVFYEYEPEHDQVTVIALGPPGLPVLPEIG
jgi:mRNA-degrading endonuclease RelE of RelBE toxin-antitoxin system